MSLYILLLWLHVTLFIKFQHCFVLSILKSVHLLNLVCSDAFSDVKSSLFSILFVTFRPSLVHQPLDVPSLLGLLDFIVICSSRTAATAATAAAGAAAAAAAAQLGSRRLHVPVELHDHAQHFSQSQTLPPPSPSIPHLETWSHLANRTVNGCRFDSATAACFPQTG